MDYQSELKKLFGFDDFRTGQKELISAIMNGQDVLGIMPTGAGKSICYQLPSALMNGLTLVISPLISLMLDQVLALKDLGIRAAFLNSTLTPNQQHTVLTRAYSGAYQIMYVAPERLLSPHFISFCQNYAIPMVTVDEAHCISQWGHNFRPDYMQIRPFIDKLPNRPIISAFTATAAPKVRQDIIDSLQLSDPFIQINSFDRPNLYFDVIRRGDKMKILKTYLQKRFKKSGIIYCTSRKNVETICDQLIEWGYAATRYHAGLSDAERAQNQEDFLYDRKPIMVATNAFGMGIDKSNVSFILHFNMPKSVEAYYQEAGRAGRDGSPADCTLLYSGRDVAVNEWLINKSIDENPELTEEVKDQQKQQEKELLKQITFYCTGTDCLRSFILQYFGENSALRCGHCGNCLGEFEDLDVSEDTLQTVGLVNELDDLCRYYGRNTLADLLKGTMNERAQNGSLFTLKYFGKLSQQTLQSIRDTIDNAVALGLLQRTIGEYPTIRITAKGETFLHHPDKILLTVSKIGVAEKSEQIIKAEKVRSGEYDEILYEKLRRERNAVAIAEKIPPYIVFSNRSLVEMAERCPTDFESFRSISGIGQNKAVRYANRFIVIIRDHLASK